MDSLRGAIVRREFAFPMTLIEASRQLTKQLHGLQFGGDVACVYNPLVYARAPHEQFLQRYGSGKKRILFLGMNPGPWGMAQTGVPFGEIAAVRDWMKIEAAVGKPEFEHAKRPITGFECERSEVSGARLWGYFAQRYPDASDFFADHFVINFCPLVWMGDTGRNITPDKIPAAEMVPVYKACREHLQRAIEILDPEWLIGVGAYAKKQLTEVNAEMNGRRKVGVILHPSPASPAANRGWAEAAHKQLEEMGI